MELKKIAKIAHIIGIVLLTALAIFHGSGILYVTEIIAQSNTEDFIKEIFPVLFAHPSFHLLGLAALGVLTLSMKQEARKISVFISILVILNSLFAFYLGAVLPGVLLLVAAASFLVGFRSQKLAEA